MFKFPPYMAHWRKTFVSLTLAIILFIGFPSPALAQVSNPQNNNPFFVAIERIKSFFVPRTKLGAPVGRSRGGAGRGRCPAIAYLGNSQTPLSALVPTTSSPIVSGDKVLKSSSYDVVWGKTIQPYPTFWFYIPYLYEESDLKYGKFVLLDEDRRIVSGPTFVELPSKADSSNQPSIAKLSLPNNKPLEVGKLYNWYFSIICDARKPSRNPSVTGWIQRVTLSIPPPKNYLYYAQSGIWYDTVTRLVESRLASVQTQTLAPTDVETGKEKSLGDSQSQIQEDWAELLRSLNISDEKDNIQIANVPIVELLPILEPEL